MVEILLFSMGATGVIVFFSSEISLKLCSIRSRFYIRRKYRSLNSDDASSGYGKLGRHIAKVIEGAELLDFYKSAEQFIILSITIFAVSVAIFTSFLDVRLVIFASIFLALVPYMLCIIRLSSRRSSGSREGDILVYELLNNYRIHNYNMKAAIEASADTIEGAPVTKSVLMNLSRELNTASSEDEINCALESFKYAFDTAWANIMASNIFLAVYRGVNVEKSLEVLSAGISKGRKVIEYEKRENYEASLMLKFLAPTCYILSLIVSVLFFDIDFSEFIYYQFRTSVGLKWFIIMIVIYFLAFFAAKIASSEKMDI